MGRTHVGIYDSSGLVELGDCCFWHSGRHGICGDSHRNSSVNARRSHCRSLRAVQVSLLGLYEKIVGIYLHGRGRDVEEAHAVRCGYFILVKSLESGFICFAENCVQSFEVEQWRSVGYQRQEKERGRTQRRHVEAAELTVCVRMDVSVWPASSWK
jgi:hypothetical protein